MSAFEEIIKIKELLDSGAITQEEFELLKQRAMESTTKTITEQETAAEPMPPKIIEVPKQSKATPVLDNWKTSIGATIGGLLSLLVCRVLLSTPGVLEMLFYSFGYASIILFFLIAICLDIFGIYYALTIYPSLFANTPKMKSNELIAFLNAFLGGPIFGLIWNYNLTNRHRGISNNIFAVLAVILVMLTIWDVLTSI
jgi:cation transport ATPase